MSIRAGIVVLLSALALGIGVSRAADGKLVRKTYSVADLVIPVGEKDSAKMNEEMLIKLITSTIAPESWAEMGGPGTIEYFPQTYGLVTNQTADVQDQVQDLLQALRRLQDQQVATEVRFAEVSEEVFQDLKRLDLIMEDNWANVAFLRGGQVRRLMERIQEDAAASVTVAPKVTAFNGQASRLDVTDEQRFVTGVDIRSHNGRITAEPKTETVPMGIRLSLRPIISADRRFVQVSLNLKWNSLVSDKVQLFPVTVPVGPSEEAGSDVQPVAFTQYIQQPRINKLELDRTMVIPDGRTAVLTGLKMECEVSKHVSTEPVLSKIPYTARLFRKTERRCETHHVLVLVTPRIVAVEETEKPEKAPGREKKSSVCPRENERESVK
jgi:type II secretory pathway component GspD/PulD (secretin)